MIYDLLLGNSCSFNEIKQTIIRLFPSEGIKMTGLDDEFDISFEGFELHAEAGGQGLAWSSEDYGMQLKTAFWFDIHTDYISWADDLMAFVGKVIGSVEGDCVLQSNGDKPILMRRNRNITVDDTKLGGTERFPFHRLGLTYKEGSIEQV